MSRDYQTMYFEQQASHTEARGMLCDERDGYKKRAEDLRVENAALIAEVLAAKVALGDEPGAYSDEPLADRINALRLCISKEQSRYAELQEKYDAVGTQMGELFMGLKRQREYAGQCVDALENVLGIMCDKELCGHFLPEEIREVVEPVLSKRPQLSKDDAALAEFDRVLVKSYGGVMPAETPASKEKSSFRGMDIFTMSEDGRHIFDDAMDVDVRLDVDGNWHTDDERIAFTTRVTDVLNKEFAVNCSETKEK